MTEESAKKLGKERKKCQKTKNKKKGKRERERKSTRSQNLYISHLHNIRVSV